MAAKHLPPPDLLRQRLRYESATGMLFWRDGCRAGKEAFTYTGNHGYRVGNFRGTVILAHRAIWTIVHGDWPADEIDHINGDRTDNRIANLRPASSRENKRNLRLRSDNTHGVPGLTLHKQGRKRWQAQIGTPENPRFSLGYFHTKDDAITARRAAEENLGYSVRHGL